VLTSVVRSLGYQPTSPLFCPTHQMYQEAVLAAGTLSKLLSLDL
jgi:hypothetical protein